jgi:uncharacterized protein (TIGR03437 family)
VSPLRALFLLAASAAILPAQTQTVGLFLNNPAKVQPGYTLLLPMHNGHTYLLNNDGQTVNTWFDGNSEPGRMAHLLPNGHLLRSVSLPNSGPETGGGDGGRITEYDWSGNKVWQFDYSTPQYAMHHDLKMLPNGNVIVLLVEVKTLAEMTAAGFRPNMLQPGFSILVPDAIIEIEPQRPTGGKIVWEWHVWDHLVQNYDSTKANYGVPSAHPELVDPNASPGQIASFWNHMNAIDYNPDLDQIMVSVRGNSEFWVIDHSTTTAEAKAHTGGKYGKGGDLLFRWGNPSMYGAGRNTDEMLYQQHDSQWIPKGRPGAGNILVFNNGVNRPGGNYSSVDELVPPVDATGNYSLTTGQAYAPKQLTWSYAGTGTERYYDGDVSGAERQPNGNTLICYGTHGLIEEVTSAGEIVWKYLNPVVTTGPLLQGQTPALDQKQQSIAALFKARKYAPDYAGLAGQDLSPKGTVELYGARYVNGASFVAGSTSPGANLTILGDSGLADSAQAAATSTLPAKMAGTSVTITDSANATQTCPLYYVSPTQINLVVPDKVATGKATLTVQRDGGKAIAGTVTVDAVAPGLFSMDAGGVGAILGLRVAASGGRSDVTVFSYNSQQKQYVATPIDLGAATDQVYLSVYGTGIRGASAVTATIGGKDVPVLGAAAQSQYPGLDQVNLGPLPRTLAGSGAVSLSLRVNTANSNSVTLSIK